jgi:Antidote-toxin recognition MazE, bacterial antitoxin
MGETSLRGPIDRVGGKLALRIPLEEGGDQFIECSRGIGEVQGDLLVVIIPEWLAERLNLKEGDEVSIHNGEGKLNIQAASPRPTQ